MGLLGTRDEQSPGLIVMTAELEAAGKSLFVNEVPEMWRPQGGGGGMSSYGT